MYVKPQKQSNSLKVPKNYSGNAFKDNVYTDLVPHFITDTSPDADSHTVKSYEEAQVHESNTPHHQVPHLPQIISHKQETSPQIEITQEQNKSIFSSILPSYKATSHFPFGHGLGSEELFILGIMLLIYISGDESEPIDSELILLLCILLFSG